MICFSQTKHHPLGPDFRRDRAETLCRAARALGARIERQQRQYEDDAEDESEDEDAGGDTAVQHEADTETADGDSSSERT